MDEKKTEVTIIRAPLNPPKEEKILTKLDILKKLSPGTALREGLNDIVSGGLGAIILVSNKNTSNIFEGGFKLGCKFNSKRLAELAKMDRAIVLSDDFKKIIYANTLLVPDKDLSSIETGTRHQAAERTAKQTGALLIVVSERRGNITAYYGNSKYVLQSTEELLRRATETLQILEKQREVFDDLLVNLNVLEVTNLVSVADVCTILQRTEMIKKMSDIINEYIIELGKEGIIVRMRMREVTKGIEKVQNLVIKDYVSRPAKVKSFFENLNFEGLLDSENIINNLFGELSESRVIPKGYRILSKTSLNENEVNNLIGYFGDLDKIFNSDLGILKNVLKEKSDSFEKEIVKLKEQILIGNKI